MQDYKEIRQRYLRGESQRHIAKTLGISRNTVKKYCEGDTLPNERKIPERQTTVMTQKNVQFIQQCLNEDAEEQLPKQAHTAKRIFDRLVAEKDYTGGESTVRAKVKELRMAVHKAFIPLQFDPGEALQVDWGEAFVYLNEEKKKVNLFCARLCYSCRPVVLAYRRQNEESFLDAFVHTFSILGGTPQKVIFDNGKVAVKDGFGSHARKQAGYTALSAHYAFDAVFCNPAEGHEKGLVEGLVGWSRRNILVPIPHIKTMEELNTSLRSHCLQYENHHIKGKTDTVGEMFCVEKASLNPLPHHSFETATCKNTRVSTTSTIRFNTNNYSVPVQYAGCPVGVKGYPECVAIYYRGKLISKHPRCFGKHQTHYYLADYLPLLEQRKRAILNAAPVKQTLPAEILAELQANASHEEQLTAILRREAAKESCVLHKKDPVTIQHVNLHAYDTLCSRNEGIHHGR